MTEMGHLQANSILLIEDDEALLDLIPRVLSQAGFVVTATASATTARKLIEETPFGVVICDLSVIGGEEAFKFILSFGPTQPKDSFLIITGNVSDNIQEQSEFNQVEIVEKPFAPTTLVAAATRLLKSRAA